MFNIKTVADVAALSEQDKAVVFAFDTARERLKAGVIRAILLPSFVVAGALLSIYVSRSIHGIDWVRAASEWVAYIGIALGLLSVPVFSRHLANDYRAMRDTKRLLADRGIDASGMRSNEVWLGLFPDKR